MFRPCDVWCIKSSELQRDADIRQFGHSRHVCRLEREFAQEHAGHHQCECGMIWEKQESDNDGTVPPTHYILLAETDREKPLRWKCTSCDQEVLHTALRGYHAWSEHRSNTFTVDTTMKGET